MRNTSELLIYSMASVSAPFSLLSLCAVLYMGSNQNPQTISANASDPQQILLAVHTTHKGRRQLPAVKTCSCTYQTHISTTGSALCLEPVAVIEKFHREKVKKRAMIFLCGEYVISSLLDKKYMNGLMQLRSHILL